MNKTTFRRRDATKYGKRHIPGQMNKTESAYAEILKIRVAAGEIERWEFESVTFKLAKGCRYTPDFSLFMADGTQQFIDVKGDYRVSPESMAKIKCAAEKFPQFLFAIEKKLAKKNGGVWQRTEY